MAMMNFMSHGTQDLYPTFLQKQRHFSTGSTAIISVISMLGAITGGTLVGLVFRPRRPAPRHGDCARLCALLRDSSVDVLAPASRCIALGAFLMQFMVQGAWGVIPAHINELSPGPLRGFFPGFAYQCGVLIAATAPYIEARMTRHFSYGQAMGMFAATVFIIAAMVIAAGPEAHRIAFSSGG